MSNDDYVICPLCHNKYKMITINHLRSKHNITLDGFKSMFPGFELECKKLKTKRVLAGLEIGSRDSVREFRSIKAKRQHESGGLHPGEYLKSTWSSIVS